ncbi:alpha/beta hydrolase [Parvibaculaceae bacterium PLY_AMNH_Bact1]|nr:alpha/beta hydrolase [Parvibaculaceae bacterium PLY_AMNH_Bact1]
MKQQVKQSNAGVVVALIAALTIVAPFGPMSARAEGLKYIDANGISFAYLEEGEGPLVLLFHGYPETARSWAQVQLRIAAAGYRVVAPFTRGYPPTSASETGDYSVRALGQDALALIGALGEERAILIGHDWGASTVYEAATADPSKVEKLIALSVPHARAVADDPSIFFEAPHFLYYQLPFIREWVAMNDFSHIDGIYQSWAPSFDVPAAELADIKATMGEPDAIDGVLGYYWSLFDAELNEGRASSAETEITVPALVIAGDADGAVSIDRYALAEPAFTGGYRFEALNDIGHFPQLEAPEKVADLIIDFLTD